MPNPENLRPNGVAQNTNFAAVGAASIEAATSDVSDGTYAQANAFTAASLRLSFGTFSIPALAQVRMVIPRVRLTGTTGINSPFYIVVGGANGPTNDTSPDPVTFQTFTGSAMTLQPNGQAWNQAAIDALEMYVGGNTQFDSDPKRIYAAYIDVHYNEAPVVSAITPSGDYTLHAQPNIGWTYFDQETDAQERFQVKVYAGTGLVSNPDATPALVESGVVFYGGAMWSLPQALPAGDYRVYVKASDVGSNGRYSAWATGTFTIKIDAPAAPALDVTVDSALARIGLFVQGRDNLLSKNQASLETDTSGWYAQSGMAAPTRSTTAGTFLHGAASLAMTVSGTPASMSARTANTSSGINVQNTAVPVTPGRVYVVLASFKAATTERNVRLQIDWFSSGGSFVSTSAGMTVADNSTGWTQAWAAGVAPSNAAYAVVLPRVAAASGTLAAGEVHYVDAIHLGPVPVRNLLSYNQSSIEDGTSGLAAHSNATIARSTAQAYQGAASLAVVGNGSSPARAGTATGLSGAPVVAGQTYTVTMWSKAATTPRSAAAVIYWYNSAGTYVSDTTGSASTNSTSVWTQHVHTATAPATAAFAAVSFSASSPANGEVHYVDLMRLFVGSINLLTLNQANLETDTSGWSATTNVALTRNTSQFLDGAASLAMTSLAAGDMNADTTVLKAPVTPGVAYTFAAWFRAATVGRNTIVYIDWLTAAGAAAGAVYNTGVNDITTGWTRNAVTGVAPANAALALVRVYVSANAAAGEVHYVDSMSLTRNDDLTWIGGDLYLDAAVLVEKSTDGGTAWSAVRGANGVIDNDPDAVYYGPVWDDWDNQQFTVWDYEVPRNQSVIYRARVIADADGNSSKSSAYTTAAAVSHAATGWWLKDPLQPATNMQLEVQPGFRFRRKQPQSVFEPVGRNVSIVVSDGVRGIEGELTVWAKSKERYDKLQNIIDNGNVLWLEDGFGRAWYIHLGAATEWELLRAQPVAGETSPIRHIHSVTLPFAEVARPFGELVAAGSPTP